ncbi:bifunctional D-cysteine desulfhydrase/1-aminocyclopropane-1-carboxylate deaminase, mitochondrial [Strongylocentrotus purpuratus]|uniref:Tryptophan synthase beta chain-like PALP domain-containing protein n=1 Tax=Strongylocentrotus purpuratus TaxID=7668 RepID=A0A7M7HE44_STRPU|nr:bifunctional D-cysteine desulfhydrase/1-aminocyclopropane-1-carboxylate deaminase, mitochondrial [Strongylocentrotus purpuratus]XP_796433.3 bifunctional D-cysteine desulfhydrase/1-aminocyclopropane-1-carboxylate deaminase, mitochondrial [Strongylocentrotus purpuratus]
MKSNLDYPLVPYEAPSWTSTINKDMIPKYTIKLGTLNTPIQRWRLPDIPDDFEVFVKRDDMTGSVLTGNKVRKLEFLMADCVDKGCQAVIACGGIFSNSCRAAAIAARQMGLDSHLLLWSKETEMPFTGNALLDRLVGSNFYLMPKDCPFQTDVYPRMRQLYAHILKTSGKKAYQIPFGGTNEIGVWGYIACFHELMGQGLFESNYTDIVIAGGSGGSVMGLGIANYLTGSKLKIHGMAACLTNEYFHNEGDKILRAHGLQAEDGSTGVKTADIVHFAEVVGIGYGMNTPEEMECIEKIATKTGIFVDPVYSSKAVYNLIKMMNESPDTLKGKKVLFIHTGGVFDLFSGVFASRMNAKSCSENRVFDWMELTDKVPSSV